MFSLSHVSVKQRTADPRRSVFLPLCGAFVVAFGEFQMMHSSFASLVTTFWPIYPANTLVVTGAIVTCVCYLGVLGGMRENRCMLITFYVLLFILMLVELAIACVFFVYNKEVEEFSTCMQEVLYLLILASSLGAWGLSSGHSGRGGEHPGQFPSQVNTEKHKTNNYAHTLISQQLGAI
ncbi:hypothetical protein ATANTOWER_026705 [Ataeniobius toweri]|uniref:NADH dehydrogenase subunit 6 n=1 Tax=Ataeniobius toweri TaxID=208326 RepID=A0ABU7A8I3_9TELE|nr:hypothetical protein [Ataeniobius toweri]